MGFNAVLKGRWEIEEAGPMLAAHSSVTPWDAAKCWDLWRAYEVIRHYGQSEAAVFDAGTYHSRILELLYEKGFRRLYGCDLAPVETKRYLAFLRLRRPDHLLSSLVGLGPLHLSRQDIHKTRYRSNAFDFITSLSVIEHGIDLARYFQEVSRLLKPGGYLITSIDYWPTHLDTGRITPFGLPWRIFTRTDLEALFTLAAEHGLTLTEPCDLEAADAPVEWQGMHYTFVFFVMRKA